MPVSAFKASLGEREMRCSPSSFSAFLYKTENLLALPPKSIMMHYSQKSARDDLSPLQQQDQCKMARPQFVTFSSVEELLIYRSKRLIELMNEREYTSPFLQCLSPTVQVSNEGTVRGGREAFLACYRMVAEAHPRCHFDVTNSSAIVDEDTGRATVILSVTITGLRDNTNRSGAVASSWTKHNDQWYCFGYQTRYGIPVFH